MYFIWLYVYEQRKHTSVYHHSAMERRTEHVNVWCNLYFSQIELTTVIYLIEILLKYHVFLKTPWIDNMCVSFGGALFQQVVGIPMGTNCAPLLADSFLYSYESEFLQNLVNDKNIDEVRAFNFTYRYIDDVLSINNSRFAEFLPLIYPPELEIKETTDHFWTYA